MTAFSPGTNAAETGPRAAVRGFLHTHRFALRRLHSLTGILFGGYIVVHLLVNATLIEGAFPSIFKERTDVYQTQVDIIHSLPFLVALQYFAILLPILWHGGYGILVAFAGRPNVTSYGYAKNWAYTVQRVTSFTLLFFIAFHIMAMKGVFGGELGTRMTFDPDVATLSTVNHIHAAWWIGWVIYPIGILSATYHLANGFWTAGITWGLTITGKSQQLWGLACLGLFAFTTFCGLASLGSALAAEPDFDRLAAIQEEREFGEHEGDPLEEAACGELMDEAGEAVEDAVD